MDAGARVRDEEEQRAVAFRISLQRHRVATQANGFVVHRRDGFGGVHDGRQALALLQTAFAVERSLAFRRVVIDFGHGFEGFLIRLRHQLEPVGFR